MGNYLTTPDTRKENGNGSGNNLKYGVSSMQGWRMNMEDSHITEPDFGHNTSLFAVFDGHGGREVAQFCGKYFGGELKKNPKYANKTNLKEALEETFFKLDEMIASKLYQKELQEMKHQEDRANPVINGGCTANVTLICDGKLYCANAGDSRTIVYSNKSCVMLSKDHKPDDEIEYNRIRKAGGNVQMGRINMGLNLSRAIGDLDHKRNPQLSPKEQMVTCFPDIREHNIDTNKDDFQVMGCDGIWELHTPQKICDIVNSRLKNRSYTKLSDISDEILDKGLAESTQGGLGCDNMSAIVINLK